MSKILEKIQKQYGDAVTVLPSTAIKIPELLSSGVIGLDIALGGGYPRGHIIQLAGWEMSYKTTHAILAAKTLRLKVTKLHSLI